MCPTGQSSLSPFCHSLSAALQDGRGADGTTAAPQPSVMPQGSLRWQQMPQLKPIERSPQDQRQPKPPSSGSVTSRERLRLRRIVRQVLALSLPIWIASCGTWQRLVNPVPQTAQKTPVVCPSSAMGPCPAPVYHFSETQIPADVAGAVAIAESKARDACSDQLEVVQDCVRDHNAKAKDR